VNDFALARYNNNGTLDMTFGSGGKVITDFAGLIDQATAVVILDNVWLSVYRCWVYTGRSGKQEFWR
jgi:hypothetical protein